MDLRGTIGSCAEIFAARAKSCNGTSLSVDLARSRALSKRIGELFSACYDGNLYSCTSGECRVVNLKRSRSQLTALAKQFGDNGKHTKLKAMRSCPEDAKKPGEVDRRKRSDDYTTDLLRALQALPTKVYRCN